MTPKIDKPPGLEVVNRWQAFAVEQEDDGELELQEAEDPGYEPKFQPRQEPKHKRLPKVDKKQWKPARANGGSGHVMPLIAEPPCAQVHALSGSSWQEVDPATKWRKIKSVMDSGASECCAPPELAPEVAIQESEGSKRGQKYTAAGGKSLENLGQKTLGMVTNAGQGTKGTWQVVDVVRPLSSVRQICRQGNRVLFGLNGGIIQNIHTGEITPFGVEDNIYTLDLWLPPAGGPEQQQCVPCGMSNDLGFPGRGCRR